MKKVHFFYRSAKILSTKTIPICVYDDHLQEKNPQKEFFKNSCYKEFLNNWKKTLLPYHEGHILSPGQSQECFDTKSGYSGIINNTFPDTEMFLLMFDFLHIGACNPSSCSVEEVKSIYEVTVLTVQCLKQVLSLVF